MPGRTNAVGTCPFAKDWNRFFESRASSNQLLYALSWSRCPKGSKAMRKVTVAKVSSMVFAMSLWISASPIHAQGPAGLPVLTVIVRHADRDPGFDPPLNAAGKQRVQALKIALRETRFSAVITSDFVRTRDTAVDALGMMPIEVKYKNRDRDAHVKEVVEAVGRQAGGVVLVVGHSETLKDIIAGLGGPRFANDICGNIYDHIFVLVPAAGRVQLVHSRYGQPSPPPQGSCM